MVFLMMEETHHFVLSRFERTRNSLERILTIIYFFMATFKRVAALEKAGNCF